MKQINRRQKWLLTACLLTAATAQQLFAQSADTLYVQESGGSVQSFALNEVRKLTFTEENVSVHPVSGSATAMPYASVAKMAFTPIVGTAPILSSDATLSGITLSEGVLSPPFAAGTFAYTVDVANSVSSISVSGTANHAAATVAGNATNQALVVDSNLFTLTVTAENGAQQGYTVTVVRAATTSTAVASAQDYGVKIYPNPVVSNVEIESATDILEVRVLNTQGTLLRYVEHQPKKVDISLSNLPAGVYVLRITNGQGVCVTKIIKQ
jgi:hypothetical protein